MTRALNRVLGHLRQVLAPVEGGPTDGQLLARFVADRDEGAFASLVRRHGPMVLGVARRILHHAEDAEDVFQATFLVLARRAGAVVKRESVGSFLYGTAYRLALAARTLNARRARERQVASLPHPAVGPADPQDWRPLFDEELSRLPEKYRAAVVLCELEGRPRREAARQLGVPEGTLSSRLSSARRLLARRLARRGLAVGVLGLGTLSGTGAQAAVSAALAASTARTAALFAAGQATGTTAAAALTKGAFKAMFTTKLQSVVAAALLAAVLGVGALTCGVGGQEPGAKPGPAADARDEKEAAALRDENARLRQKLKELQDRLAALEDKRVADAISRKVEEERAREQDVETRRRLERLARARDEAAADKAKLLEEAQAQLAETQRQVRALQERIAALQDELRRARGHQEDPVAAAEAALKDLRGARDKEGQRRAVEALEKALRQIKEQLK
jgi:RNA polymerase sigma factor (sigma-70 family)